MNRPALFMVVLALSIAGCKAGTAPTAPKAPPAPQKFGAVVPLGTNVYPRGFYNTTAPAPANGDSVNLQLDSGGALKTILDHNDHTADATFTLTVWRQNGGSALATDPDPNVTPPSAGAILRISARRGAIQVEGIGNYRLFAKDGTSLSFQPWFYDDTIAVWMKFGPVATITVGTTNLSASTVVGNMVGAKFFFQITANTGVTALGIDYI